jgi:peptide deformylase
MPGPAGRNRRVVLYGHPALRTRSSLIADITPELRQLFADLKASMLTQDGLGLAANQIAEAVAVFAVNPRTADCDQEPYCVLNPRLTATEGTVEAEEGCLSMPGLFDFLPRPELVRLAGMDENGQPLQVEATGLLARALMHEIDHLNGVLFIDRLSESRRKMLVTKLKELESQEAASCA